jgi:hypothetical protein
MSGKTAEEARNEQVIRSLYAPAEGNVKDTSKFVSMFTDDGYFYPASLAAPNGSRAASLHVSETKIAAIS